MRARSPASPMIAPAWVPGYGRNDLGALGDEEIVSGALPCRILLLGGCHESVCYGRVGSAWAAGGGGVDGSFGRRRAGLGVAHAGGLDGIFRSCGGGAPWGL